MRHRVLVYSRFSNAVLGPAADLYDLINLEGRRPAEVLPPETLQPVRVVIAAGGRVFDRAMMESLPSLEAIVCYGAGYDGIDLDAARERGIRIANSPGANASTVADMAMALLLASMRRLVVADGYVRSGDWASGVRTPLGEAGAGMEGRRIGVFGMGEIGRRIAMRAAAFEADIGYFSRRPVDGSYRHFESLAALADWADVLMIAVRASHETRHAVDADILSRLGTTGFVVNIARGSVIDQAALTAAVVEGRIAGAGLDVFETEPQPLNALTAHPNVVLAPHIGGHTSQAHLAMRDRTLANLAAFFADEDMLSPVRF